MKIKVPNIISLWVEKYYPLLFTIVICVLLYVFRSMPVINYLYISVYDDTFLTAILTALSIIFGFLLTALTTLYQSPSRAVKEIKQVGRFDELISYNKKAVKWVFFSVVFTAVFLLSFKLDSKKQHYDFFVGVWLYITVYSTFLSYRFLDIFYVLL